MIVIEQVAASVKLSVQHRGGTVHSTIMAYSRTCSYIFILVRITAANEDIGLMVENTVMVPFLAHLLHFHLLPYNHLK